MSCNCGRNNIINSKKSNKEWVINRAIQISQLREEDIQIYKKDDWYEIEFPPNPSRENIIKVIKWQELE